MNVLFGDNCDLNFNDWRTKEEWIEELEHRINILQQTLRSVKEYEMQI